MSKWIKYEIDSNTLEFRYESDSNNQNFSDETDSNIPKTKLEEIIKVPRLIGIDLKYMIFYLKVDLELYWKLKIKF